MYYLIFALAVFAAEPKPVIPFGTKAVFADGLVEADLLKVHDKEIAAARKKGAKSSTALSSELQAKNRQLLADLAKKAQNAKGISKESAERVRASIANHPVVGDKAMSKYDTWDRMIGYCFGRAAFVHWDLLRRGADQRGIGKLFAVGGVRQQQQNAYKWDYHVATVVRADEGGWWVIDGLLDRVMKADEWMSEVLKWSLDPKHPQLRFHFTDAGKFHPTPGVYDTERMMIPEYKGYFADLIDWFRTHPATQDELVLAPHGQ